MTIKSTKYELKEAVATITMDRDYKRNAFNEEMTGEIKAHIDSACASGARVIVLRANPGVSVWCAGHDLSDFKQGADLADDPMKYLCDHIQDVPVPVISMVEGAVYAGGLILNLAADIAIAAENVTVTMTANKMGIPFPASFYAYWLRVCGIHKAKELLFTAAPVSAQDAYTAGIFNHVVPLGDLEGFTAEIAGQIVACVPQGIANSKLQLNLIARSLGLSREELEVIQADRRRIIEGKELQSRIDALLAGTRGTET
jgi:methylmalonyl-CoA decarboxylase